MKSFLRWVLVAIWLFISCSTVSPHVYANKLCDWFGCTNFVSDVKVPKAHDANIDASLLDTIKATINWILGILATIAVVICLYAWFKMLTSWGDSKWYDAWWKTLKNAALWLVIIWLSWIIVSAIFWFVNLQSWDSSMLVS